MIEPEDGVRATEDVGSDVSVISLTKNSDHSINYYLTHLRGQIICNSPILQEKTERLRVKRGLRSQGVLTRKISQRCAEHSINNVQTS